MTDITTQQAYARPTSKIERQANALDELRQLHAEFNVLQNESVEQKRVITHLNDRNHLLLEQLRTAQQNERIMTRKLMRLAQSMANIGLLTKEAETIMRSVQEYQEDESHHQIGQATDDHDEEVTVIN